MKSKTIQQLTVLILAAAVPMVFTACNEDDHDHEHHDGDGHSDAEHDHDHDHDHADAAVRPAGPNGGRIITDVEPHVEFFITEDRKVKITSLNDDSKPSGAAPAFDVVVTGGDRSNPTRLLFAKEGEVLVSDGSLPDGKMFPVVVQFKAGDEKPTMSKFNVDMNECPTCSYLEYACICAHAGDHDHDHDHDHKKE